MKINRVRSEVASSYNQKFLSELLEKEEWKSLLNIDKEYLNILTGKYLKLFSNNSNKKYYISNLGRVGYIDFQGNLDILPVLLNSGTLQISIHSKSYEIHKLVAFLFIKNNDIINNQIVCRKNPLNKLDNSINNLFWGNRSDATKFRSPKSSNNIKQSNNIIHSNKDVPHSVEPIVRLNIDNTFNKLYLNCSELKNDNIKNTNNITRQCKENQEKDMCISIKEGYKWMFLNHYNKKNNNSIDLNDYIQKIKGCNIIIRLTPVKKIIKIYKDIYEILNDGFNLSNVVKSCDEKGSKIKMGGIPCIWMYLDQYLKEKKYESLNDIKETDYKK